MLVGVVGSAKLTAWRTSGKGVSGVGSVGGWVGEWGEGGDGAEVVGEWGVVAVLGGWSEQAWGVGSADMRRE